jgi:hypothetical protein
MNMMATYTRPHPGPLPPERENYSPLYDTTNDGEKFNDFEVNQSQQQLFPLPEGEGQGEGKRSTTNI